MFWREPGFPLRLEYQDEEVVNDCPRWLIVPVAPFAAGGRVSVLESNQLRCFGVEDGDPDEPFLATVDAATGRLIRRLALPGSFGQMTAPPVLASGALWLSQAKPLAGTEAAAPGSGAILAVDQATGRLRAQIVLPMPLAAPPLVAGAWLYLLTADHAVQVIDPGTGVLHQRLAVAEDQTPIPIPNISCRLAAGKRLARGPAQRRTGAPHHCLTGAVPAPRPRHGRKWDPVTL